MTFGKATACLLLTLFAVGVAFTRQPGDPPASDTRLLQAWDLQMHEFAEEQASAAYQDFVRTHANSGTSTWIDSEARRRYDNVYRQAVQSHKPEMWSATAFTNNPSEMQRRAEAYVWNLAERSASAMGMTSARMVIDEVRVLTDPRDLAHLKGAGAAFGLSDSRPARRVLYIDPRALRERTVAGSGPADYTAQLRVVLHEMLHGAVHMSNVRRFGEDAAIKMLSKGSNTRQYAAEEVWVDRMAGRLIEGRFGYLHKSTADSIGLYTDHWDKAANSISRRWAELTRTYLSRMAHLLGGPTPTPDTRDIFRSRRLAAFHAEIQAPSPFFGGLVLGAPVAAPGLRLIDSEIVDTSEGASLRLHIERDGGNRQWLTYDDFSPDELWSAYHVLQPTPEMLAHGASPVVPGLLHCQTTPDRMGVTIAAHPAIANTSVGVSAVELDLLPFVESPWFKAICGFDSFGSVQWYDAPTHIRVGEDGHVRVIATKGSPDCILRVHLWVPADPSRVSRSEWVQCRVNDSPPPEVAEVLDSFPRAGQLRILSRAIEVEEAEQRAVASIAESKEPITQTTYSEALTTAMLEIQSDSLQKVELPGFGAFASTLMEREPAMRTLDRFARLCALLRWIEGELPEGLPALPSEVKAFRVPMPDTQSLAEIAKSRHVDRPRTEIFGELVGPEPMSSSAERHVYAVFIGGSASGILVWTREEHGAPDTPVIEEEATLRLFAMNDQVATWGHRTSGTTTEGRWLRFGTPDAQIAWMSQIWEDGQISQGVQLLQNSRVRYTRGLRGGLETAFPIRNSLRRAAPIRGGETIECDDENLYVSPSAQVLQGRIRMSIGQHSELINAGGREWNAFPVECSGMTLMREQRLWVTEDGGILRWEVRFPGDPTLHALEWIDEGGFATLQIEGPIAASNPWLTVPAFPAHEVHTSREADSITMRLNFSQAIDAATLPRTQWASFHQAGDNEVEVRLIRPTSPDRATLPTDADRDLDDPRFALQGRLQGAGGLPDESAGLSKLVALEHLEAYVRQRVPFTLPTSGLDSFGALETLAGRAGDCTERASALVGLARSRDWPARMVIGFVYVESSRNFIAHAWAEVWLDDGWRRSDPSLPDAQRAAYLPLYVASRILDTHDEVSLLPSRIKSIIVTSVERGELTDDSGASSVVEYDSSKVVGFVLQRQSRGNSAPQHATLADAFEVGWSIVMPLYHSWSYEESSAALLEPTMYPRLARSLDRLGVDVNFRMPERMFQHLRRAAALRYVVSEGRKELCDQLEESYGPQASHAVRLGLALRALWLVRFDRCSPLYDSLVADVSSAITALRCEHGRDLIDAIPDLRGSDSARKVITAFGRVQEELSTRPIEPVAAGPIDK